MDSAGGPRPASWWARLIATSDQFDAAYFLEAIAGDLVPQITNHLLRREVELAVATVNRHLLRPDNAEFTEDAEAGRQRLTTTLGRLGIAADAPPGPAHADDAGNAHAVALCRAVDGDYPAAAAHAERLLGGSPVLHAVVTALRFERFDDALTVRLLIAGRPPADAVRAGRLIGGYSWWPGWLLELAAEQALAGKLDEALVAALDRCAYAPLTAAQTHLARKLLTGDKVALAAAADNLDRLGEQASAQALRTGDLTAVALAAKLMYF